MRVGHLDEEADEEDDDEQAADVAAGHEGDEALGPGGIQPQEVLGAEKGLELVVGVHGCGGQRVATELVGFEHERSISVADVLDQ